MPSRTAAAAPRVEPIRIGVSACLLGHTVRYDGGHKRDAFLVETFGRYVEWVPVCPEVELGLGTPRPTLRLERAGGDIRLIMPHTGTDHSDAMRRYADQRLGGLETAGLCGYILKKNSPSCGMERVRVYGSRGGISTAGRGVFAEALLQRFPLLPVEEEGRLNDLRLRDHFIERVFAYHRLRALFSARWRLGDVVAFHGAHKLQLLAHSPPAYPRLGRLVARAKAMARPVLRQQYESGFAEALALPATPVRHVNVLQHMVGYFRTQLDAESRHELSGVIAEYRAGVVPLVAPVTLVRRFARRFDVAYLLGQSYLDPYPKELMSRR